MLKFSHVVVFVKINAIKMIVAKQVAKLKQILMIMYDFLKKWFLKILLMHLMVKKLQQAAAKSVVTDGNI